jgi:hypothetical protein
VSASEFGWYRPWLSGIQDAPLPSRAKAVAAVLARDERDGRVERTATWIGAKASLNERTVRRALDDLKAAGRLTARPTRDRLVIELLRSDTTPDLGGEVGHHARPGSDTTPGQNGHHARPRSDTTPDRTTAVSTRATAPRSPEGNRKRDLARFDDELRAWSAQHFPDADWRVVRSIVGTLRAAGRQATAAAVQDFAKANPLYQLQQVETAR